MTWVEVYPYKFDENGTVTLYAENGVAVQVDKSGADRFTPETTGIPGTTGTTGVPGSAQTSPLSPIGIVGAIAIGMAVWLRSSRR